MDPNLNKVAEEIYGKIETRFRPIKIADAETKVLSKKTDIPKARWFEFDYKENGEKLGTISITLDEHDGVVIKAGGDLIDKDTNETHHGAYKFIRSFRDLARRNLLNYQVDNLGKSNLDKRDYEFHAKDGEENMMESKLYGTPKVSYQDIGNAKLIVRHTQAVNFDLPAGRTMHIESIYVENAQGERFRYPARHLNGARAMAQHIGHGGNPYDEIGQHIVGLSEELMNLRMFKGYVGRNAQLGEAMSDVTDKVVTRIEGIKEELQALQRSSYYEQFAEAYAPSESKTIPEDIMNDWVDRLTIRTFKDELKNVFPYIYRLVDESELPTKELNPDDILGERNSANKAKKDKAIEKIGADNSDEDNETRKERGMRTSVSNRIRGREVTQQTKNREHPFGHNAELDEAFAEEREFMSFMDYLVNESLDDLPDLDDENTKDQIKDMMAQELKGFPNIIDTVKAVYPDPTLLASLEGANPNVDARALVIQYFENNHPEWYKNNKDILGGSEEAGSKPEEEKSAETPPPAPETPAAETPPAAPEETPPAGGGMAPAATPPAGGGMAPAAPMSESDDSPPWDVDPKDKKSKPTTAGKYGQGYSQARHLARQGLAKALDKAKKAGAKSDTKVGNKTIAEMVADAGFTLEEFGFEPPKEIAPPSQPAGSSKDDMMKFASGFYNREKKNFTLGGTGVKVKIDKQFPDADPREKEEVFGHIDHIDPSSSVHQKERIRGLAGLQGDNKIVHAQGVMESYLD